MERVAKFYKVSYDEFTHAMVNNVRGSIDGMLREWYDSIKLPTRATNGSAGYDFHIPMNLVLAPGQTMRIPTGVRAWIQDGWVLKLYPRSGIGMNYKVKFDNTVGIIDSDYFYSDNEGHIMAQITNHSNESKILKLEPGERFMQGVFVQYGITEDDEVRTTRNGGMGSTGA